MSKKLVLSFSEGEEGEVPDEVEEEEVVAKEENPILKDSLDKQ